MNAISCMSWVRRGVSKKDPDRVKLDEEELIKLVSGENDPLQESDSDAEEDSIEAADDSDSSKNDIDKKYKLNDYDEDESAADSDDENSEDETDSDEESLTNDSSDNDQHPSKAKSKPSGLRMAGIAYYGSNKKDPYISQDAESSDEEAEILPDDNLLAIGKVSGEFCGMEVYVYNEATSSLYCHHDTILGSFPLAMEWVGYDPGEQAPGNLLAIGSMEPHIELWDLDIIDTLEPAFVLKGLHKRKGKKKSKISITGHSDAVLDLSWNSLQTQVLASGSADFTIGLWDLDQGAMVTTIKHHTEKVQALQWHPFEHQTLLSGSFDKTVKVYDCRTSESSHKSWTLPGEVERVTWNKHDPYYFLASTECGHVICLDVRNTKPLFTVKAHESAVSGLTISSDLAGCLLTSSSDKVVKVWDIRQNEPEMVFSKNYQVGKVMTLIPCPDSGCVFAVGGERELRVIHLRTAEGVVEKFEQPAVSSVMGPEERLNGSTKIHKKSASKTLKDEGTSSDVDSAPPEQLPEQKVTAGKKKKKKHHKVGKVQDPGRSSTHTVKKPGKVPLSTPSEPLTLPKKRHKKKKLA